MVSQGTWSHLNATKNKFFQMLIQMNIMPTALKEKY